jgi:hypothetical protein
MELAKFLDKGQDAYLLDLDKIAASIGRRYMQDDSIKVLSRNSVIPTLGEVTDRIEQLRPMSEYYKIN